MRHFRQGARRAEVDSLFPAQSNHRLADIARHHALRALAAAGVRVWLAPHMLHAKAAIIDDVLALVGSTNLDSRSLVLITNSWRCFMTPAISPAFPAGSTLNAVRPAFTTRSRPGFGATSLKGWCCGSASCSDWRVIVRQPMCLRRPQVPRPCMKEPRACRRRHGPRRDQPAG